MGRAMAPIIPRPTGIPPVEYKLRVQKEMADAIEEVARTENAERAEGEKLARNDVLVHLLSWALKEWRRERDQPEKKSVKK